MPVATIGVDVFSSDVLRITRSFLANTGSYAHASAALLMPTGCAPPPRRLAAFAAEQHTDILPAHHAHSAVPPGLACSAYRTILPFHRHLLLPVRLLRALLLADADAHTIRL